MPWQIESITPTLAVPVLAVGIEYYTRLGFTLEWTWPEQAPRHAGLRLGACTLELAECDPAVQATLTLVVDDVDACHTAVTANRPWELAQRISATGPPARSMEPPPNPTDRPYGKREFTLIDPWGHSFTFSTPLNGV